MHNTVPRAKHLIPAAILLGTLAILLAAIAAAVTDRSIGYFTRDVRTLCEEAGAKVPFYTGAISQFNIMTWAAAGTLSVFVAWLQPERRRWLLGFGVLLFVFAADDSLTLHESGPHRVLPEKGFYVVYALIGLALLIAVVRRGVDDPAVAFLIGGGLLAVSVIVDESVQHQYIWEDTAKLLGALVWLTVPPLSLREPGKLPPDSRRGRRARKINRLDDALTYPQAAQESSPPSL